MNTTIWSVCLRRVLTWIKQFILQFYGQIKIYADGYKQFYYKRQQVRVLFGIK